MLPRGALSVTSWPAVTADWTVIDPPDVTDTLPVVAVTPLSEMEPVSVTVRSEPAVAANRVASVCRSISPVALAVTVPVVTRPAPEMLPPVALSVAAFEAVMLPGRLISAAVSETVEPAALVATVKLAAAVAVTPPAAVTAPSVRSSVSLTVTLAALVTLNAPPKSLASSSTMS